MIITECIRIELCIMYECFKHVTLMLATKGAWIPTGTNTDKDLPNDSHCRVRL